MSESIEIEGKCTCGKLFTKTLNHPHSNWVNGDHYRSFLEETLWCTFRCPDCLAVISDTFTPLEIEVTPEEAFRAAFPPGPANTTPANMADLLSRMDPAKLREAVEQINEKETENGR
jgi:hypothetical protein